MCLQFGAALTELQMQCAAKVLETTVRRQLVGQCRRVGRARANQPDREPDTEEAETVEKVASLPGRQQEIGVLGGEPADRTHHGRTLHLP
ncbi:hypothetical protein Rwratislav_36319 [Rhodococcus wratislaviensis IFP 2016]|nr:hypothetical protein Rwratislav_36319 [Rhodococcus wratislaviensis IFP 2016]